MAKQKTGERAETTSKAKSAWWEDGVRFACQGSGKCCVSHGEFGYVYLTGEDRTNMARVLGLTRSAFTKKYCKKTDGVWHTKDREGSACIFLEGKRCSVYEARPMQCRTWPFWPEVMNAKSWAKEVKAFCPGVGKGRLIKADEIRTALAAQEKWEDELKNGL
jgi:Fe-S-cluster containining protein